MIESLQNDKIKNLVRLTTDNRFRKKSKLFVVEGQQENERAIQYGYENNEFFICEAIYKNTLPLGKIHFVSEKIYEKIAYRGTVEGIIGVYHIIENSIEDFTPQNNSTIIIVESIEKPGNLGAILRSCEAFGIDALIVADPKIDFFNPNVIRSSVGCLFGMNIFSTENEKLLKFLENNKYQILTTFMDESAKDISYYNLNNRSAILFGTEHSGLSDFWLGKGQNALIPMAGTIDSLNLSNAVAITCYETLRQKKTNLHSS